MEEGYHERRTGWEKNIESILVDITREKTHNGLLVTMPYYDFINEFHKLMKFIDCMKDSSIKKVTNLNPLTVLRTDGTEEVVG